jgi:hypothetical protein
MIRTHKEWVIQFDFYSTGVHPIYYLRFNEECTQFNNIDDLITKLQELTQSESKYKKGQEVFYCCDNEIYDFKIREIHSNESTEFLYSGDGHDVYECDLYLTKEALIESQLVYWSSLMAKEELKHKQSSCSESIRKHHELEEECTHQSDGMIYTSSPPQNKCKKCGEFYR